MQCCVSASTQVYAPIPIPSRDLLIFYTGREHHRHYGVLLRSLTAGDAKSERETRHLCPTYVRSTYLVGKTWMLTLNYKNTGIGMGTSLIVCLCGRRGNGRVPLPMPRGLKEALGCTVLVESMKFSEAQKIPDSTLVSSFHVPSTLGRNEAQTDE